MIQETVKLGDGIYTAPDAARILDLPYSKIHYWFKQYMKEKFEKSLDFQYYFVADDVVAVNFYTLIELYVFYQLKEQQVKVSSILEAHESISVILDTPYPFANSQLLVSGGEILFEHDLELVSADKKLQFNLREVILPFCSKIEFGKDEIARKFYPLGKSKSVVVNPKNQFGMPVIDGTNITVEAIYNMFKAGDSISMIAKLYDLEKRQIQEAISFAKAA